MQEPNEKELTAGIRKLLKEHGGFFYKAWQAPMSTSGVADLIGVLRGMPVAIEVKGLRGKVSEEQERFLRNWKEVGGIGFVARSVEDVISELGLPVLF